MPVYRVYLTYSLPEYIDVEAEHGDEALELAATEIMELVDIDLVNLQVEELEEEKEEEEEEKEEEEEEKEEE